MKDSETEGWRRGPAPWTTQTAMAVVLATSTMIGCSKAADSDDVIRQEIVAPSASTAPARTVVHSGADIANIGVEAAQQGAATPATAAAALKAQAYAANIRGVRAEHVSPISRPISRPAVSSRATVIVHLQGSSLESYQTLDDSKFFVEVKTLEARQARFMTRLERRWPGAKIIARTRHLLNAVFVEIDRDQIPALKEDPDAVRVVEVKDYQMSLSETVPYLGGAAAHAAGFEGVGIRVAVIDSGIDYHHAALGGSGLVEDYDADDPAIIEPGSFPTTKIVGGTDFIGSEWPRGPLAPDPDPLDDGPGGGHGTHVADIIGGTLGVAPGASLYALKVCSSVASSCSGVGLAQALEFAVDPNGDGRTNDHVDIINMSLGSDYGQPFDDDLSLAVERASALGVLTVSSAGNGADRPFVAGTPAATRSAISVAQTQVPSAHLTFMTVDFPVDRAGDFMAVPQRWSGTLADTMTGPVQYADGQGGNLNGCEAFAEGSLTGQIVYVDRGACNFSNKIRNIEEAGGVLGIIGLVTPGEPFFGSFGGGDPISIPGYMISQADADILRAGDAIVTFDPNNIRSLAGSMVSSSSRGPRNYDVMIKPDVGAPGASVSALVGTGDQTSAFGGTSGASPMVAGAAAVLLEARLLQHRRPLPFELKALLANTAEETIANDQNGAPAAVTRVGSGEVRLDRAIVSPVAAWDDQNGTPSLSFGFKDVADDVLVLRRQIRVRNYTARTRNFNVHWSYRHTEDDTGAVVLETPATVRVDAQRDAVFEVVLTIHGSMLPSNAMSSGAEGADPASLTLNEFDGDVFLDDGRNAIHLPWHVLPRKSASVHATRNRVELDSDGQDRLILTNAGQETAQNEVFSLVGLSPNLPSGAAGAQEPTPDLRAFGVRTATVAEGVCGPAESFVWRFAFNSWERQTHLVAVNFGVRLDIDGDGKNDFIVRSGDLSEVGSGSTDGRQITLVEDLAQEENVRAGYVEHAMNTANTIIEVCAEQIGLSGADLGLTHVKATVTATDTISGGPGDRIDNLTLIPGGEEYIGKVEDVPANASGTLEIQDLGPLLGATPELGVMVVTNSDRGEGHRGGATQDSETLLLLLPNVFLPE